MKINRNVKLLWLITLIAAVLLSPPVVRAADKKIIGLIEMVRICPSRLEFKAKIDTGAQNSSLDVDNIEAFERDGNKWVRFDVVNFRGQKRTLEKPVVRTALIKRHKNKAASRYVIKLGICLGEYYQEVEFNLADRTGFNYRMLIGCSFLQGVCIVDPSLKYTTHPRCKDSCEK